MSELRGLAAALEGTDCNLVAISTDSVEAHKVVVIEMMMVRVTVISTSDDDNR